VNKTAVSSDLKVEIRREEALLGAGVCGDRDRNRSTDTLDL